MCAKEGGRLCRTVFNGGVGSRDALGYSGQVEPGRGMKRGFLDRICSSEKQEEDIKWRNRDRQLEKKRDGKRTRTMATATGRLTLTSNYSSGASHEMLHKPRWSTPPTLWPSSRALKEKTQGCPCRLQASLSAESPAWTLEPLTQHCHLGDLKVFRIPKKEGVSPSPLLPLPFHL